MVKIGHVLSWDQGQIFNDEVDYLMEEEGLTEIEAQNRVSDNCELYTFPWECTIESFNEILKKVTSRFYNKITEKDYDKALFYVEGYNLGWRNRSGFKVVEAGNALDLIRGVLPKTDCTWFVHRPEDKREPSLSINNYHHDSPTGEWYHLRPLNTKEAEAWYDGGYSRLDEVMN